MGAKLTALLEQFSAHDLNRFQRFLESSYINENQDIVRLFEWTVQGLKNDSKEEILYDKQLNKKDVWKKLYPARPYNDLQLRRLSSDLTQLAFQFLFFENIKEDRPAYYLRMMDLLNQRKLDKHFKGIFRQMEKDMEAAPYRNAGFHHQQFRKEALRQQFIERPGIPFEDLSSLENADHHLDCYYISRKLKHYCDSLGYESFLSIKAQLHISEGFLNSVSQGPYAEVPAVKAYLLVADLLTRPEKEGHFFQLQSFLSQHAALFPPRECKTLYTHLNNYCIIKRINAGRSEFFHHLFDNYKLMLSQKLMLDEGQIAPQDYKNVITVGLQVEAYDWVEQFIQEYTPKLPESNQENALTYNLAKVYFHQKKYGKVIEQLREVAHSTHMYALGGKQILIKTYYEMDEFLPLDSLLQSFRAYLRRNKVISKDVREQYLNFLRFLKRLSYMDPYHKEKLEKLKKDIQQCSSVAQKKWLIEKVEELK